MSMEIAVTGGSGRLGRVLIEHLLQRGYRVRNLDRVAPPAGAPAQAGREGLTLLDADLNDLAKFTDAIRGCEAVIHLAAFPGLGDEAPGVVYANNTLVSYNVLQATSSLGIRRVCLASSIHALGGFASRKGRFDYLPVDEKHPTYNEDDYSLSKWVLEQQADSFARRFPDMTLSSLRFHALVQDAPELQHTLDPVESGSARGLWGWTQIQEGARACELALMADYRGHEVFYIIAPRTSSAIPSLELAAFAYPNVPVRGDLSDHKAFYDCRKAARLLGWTLANP